jgi:hypothetical protein
MKMLFNYVKLSLLSCLFLFGSIHNAFANQINSTPDEITSIKSKAVKLQYGNIPVLVLSGTTEQMGIQYGGALSNQLKTVLSVLKNYYITGHGLTYQQLLTQASLLYNRFPIRYQSFMQGVAQGSGLDFRDIIILNGMETLGELLQDKTQVACAFLFVPPGQTTTGAALIGRNYDYPEPFDQLARYLTVSVMNEPGKVPTAFISIPGEIYCPSCVNANGLFMELNNGTPSGGHIVDTNTQSMLATMLDTLQNSSSLSDVQTKLSSVKSDFSLIVNTANSTMPLSFEYSTDPSLGTNYYYPTPTQTFAVTNFYLDPVWGDRIPVPTDATTWEGVTRRNNLLNLASKSNQFNVYNFQTLMNVQIDQGGAVWGMTIYQLIFDASTMDLYVRLVNDPATWNRIPLSKVFKNDINKVYEKY